MLDITVKTMDSQSRSFQVPESMSVGDFKRRICDSVNIAVDSQRLIFQGRVLGDTMKLTSDHHEKTLHLVQRAQSSTSTSSAATGAAASTTSGSTTNSGTSRPTTTSAPPPHPHLMPTLDILNQMFAGQGMFAGTPVIGRVHHQGTSTAADGSMNIEINLEDPRNFTQQPPSTSQHQHSRRAAADSRVNFERMWRTLQLLTNIADTHSSTTPTATATTATAAGSENNEQTSSESTPSDETGNTSTTTTDSTTAQDNSRLASGGTSNIHSQNSRPRLRQPLVSELRDFYSQFIQVQGRLQPMFNQYQRFLQDDPAFTSTNSREYQDSYGFFQLVPQVLRHMADIYDFLANISIPLERVPPRPVMMTNNSRSRRSSNRAPSGGITLGQMVRGHQHQTTPPPSGGISSTQRTSTNTATGRRRFCMHQPGRSGSAAASATGSSGGSPTTTQRRSNRPSTTGATSSSGSSSSGNTQQSATSTTQQRTLPPYAFQINTIFYQRATQLPSSSSSSGDSGQQQQGSGTTTSATTTSATNETTISNQQEQEDSTNVTATSSLSSTQQEEQGGEQQEEGGEQQGEGGEQQGEVGEQQGIEERKRKNPTLPDSSDVSSNKKSK